MTDSGDGRRLSYKKGGGGSEDKGDKQLEDGKGVRRVCVCEWKGARGSWM